MAQEEDLKDSLLLALAEDLPTGWSVRVDHDTLYVERHDSLHWVVVRQMQRVPANWRDPYQNAEMITYDGKHGLLSIRMPCVSRWPQDKLDGVRLGNESLDRQKAKARIELGVDEFYDSASEDYQPKNKKQTRRLERYNFIVDSLNSERKEVPFLSSPQYSIFLSVSSDYRFEAYAFKPRFYPVEVDQEYVEVTELIHTHLGMRVLPFLSGREED